MGAGKKLTRLLVAGMLCLPVAAQAETQTAPAHRTHKATKPQPPPPPLPSGTQGPVPQIPLDSIPAVAPQVSYQDGLLTIVAPNSTLADILRGVRKQTPAEIEIPASASERVVTHLGPAPAREVMAELLNGSRFNYVLLGSPQDANALVKVVLVAKTGPDNPGSQTAKAGEKGVTVQEPQDEATAGDTPDAPEAAEDTPDDNADQSAAAEPEQPAAPDEPGVKTPQQLLQEMQQRQLLMQQQQQQVGQPGVPPQPLQIPHQPPDQQ